MGMREIAPYGLRLPPKLKTHLEDQAKAGGRSLQKEIVMRLESSLEQPSAFHEARQNVALYDLSSSETEAEVLRLFRKWPVEKQLAFLSLFK